MRRIRTVQDWVERLLTFPAELPEAMLAPQSAPEWRTLLRGVMPWASPAQVEAIADLTLEAAAREADVWGFRDVAQVRQASPSRAHEALRAGVELFRREPPNNVYVWLVLGDGFLALQDLDGLRACLAAGLEMGRAKKDSSALCRVAEVWGRRLDEATGKALLTEAETLLQEKDVSALANAWQALGEPQAAERVLAHAEAQAATFASSIRVAQARVDIGQPVSMVTLAKAESLAVTAGEWLDVASFASSQGVSVDEIRRVLAHAEGLIESADDPQETRSRVARAYFRWLGDATAAARVGPRGVRPEALRATISTGADWPTSASGLFDWLRLRVTDENLRRIAEADYGQDAEAHFTVLKDVCVSGLVPREFDWEPHEVLALTRWSSGEATHHLERGLCTLLLCLAPGEIDDEFVTNGVILLDSCLVLGPDASELAAQFFAWHAQNVEDDESISLLLLLMSRAAVTPSDPRLQVLAVRLDESSGETLEDTASRITTSLRVGLWEELLERVLMPMRDDAVRHVLSRLGVGGPANTKT